MQNFLLLSVARFLFLVNIGILVFFSAYPPDRPALDKKDKPVPQIAGPSFWGLIEQNGKKIKIDGDPKWYVATGEIRADGKLFVLWIHREDGRVGPGLYTLNQDGSITGHWAWGDAQGVEVDDKGNWRGLNQPDTIRYPPMPDL